MKIAPLVALALVAPLGAAQSTRILVDLGTTGFPTNGTVAETWNDVVQTAPPAFELLDDAGQPSGIWWDYPIGTFDAANSAGTSTPQAGSPLAAFPPSATRDVMYGSGGSTVVIELSGFAPNTLVDLTFAASRIGVSDMRTTDYLVQGFNGALATLDPSNNTSQTATVSDILVDSSGALTISVRAAPSNTNEGTHYYYLGVVQVDAQTSPTTPQILAFDQPALNVSRPQGAGLFVAQLTLLESLGATPAVTLGAVDDATGLAPTWLSVPAGAVVGSPFGLTLDESAVPLGTYTATVTASAAGYPDVELPVSLTVRDPAAINVLWYGNSYSLGNQTVPALVKFIAEDAGYASPNVVGKMVGGQNLFFHLTDPQQAAAITDALPLGEEWDFVVMQGFSTEATDAIGDPQAFRANALAILTNVRAHSPNARAVMFQTWARGFGHSFYPGIFEHPLVMHAQIRKNYQLAVADLNAAFGPGTAFDGAAGDAVALLAFEPYLYDEDLSHPKPPTTLLAAMTIFQALWRDRVCDVSPDFAGPSNLANRLTSLGLTAADWDWLSGIAERSADAELRRYPGSTELLLLTSGVDGPLTARPLKTAVLGQLLSAQITSPNGVYRQVPAVLLLDAFATGFPPGMLTPWSELHLNPATTLKIASASPLGNGLSWQIVVPPDVAGYSVFLQGVAFGPSPTTGHGFTATDGHEIVLQ